MISISYRNTEGEVVFAAGMIVGILAYFGPAELIGESLRLKGVAWLLAGIVMVAPDIASLLPEKYQVKVSWITRWAGGWTGLPIWVVGLIGLGGGVLFLFSLE